MISNENESPARNRARTLPSLEPVESFEKMDIDVPLSYLASTIVYGYLVSFDWTYYSKKTS